MTVLKNLFIGISKNDFLNDAAKKYGLKLGAQSIVAGTTIEEMIQSIKELNAQGISCTIDNLGEFLFDKEEVLKAKERVLAVVKAIHENEVDAHLSLKPSQLGLDVDYDFCVENLEDIVRTAGEYGVFVNLDMEDYPRLQPSLDILEVLAEKYDNVGTVIQSYFYRAEEDVNRYKDLRLRLVKGAYQESDEVAYQSKEDIDANFIKVIEHHLLNGKFTSIGTHDHHIINHVKQFVEEHNISNDQFEFQLLFGFRIDLQKQLAKEGYNVCTYVPFGEDWFGYFMRRLAERPQNMNLVTKQVFNKKTNTILAVGLGAFLLGRLTKKKK